MRNRTARFTTSMGEFQVELFEDRAPRTTGNFVDLVEKEFYDGVTFHRVVARALVQTRDPTDTGGSQFFITLDTLSSLDGEHAIFSQVIQGMDVVRRISQVRVNAFDRPLERVTLEKIRIEAGPPG